MAKKTVVKKSTKETKGKTAKNRTAKPRTVKTIKTTRSKADVETMPLEESTQDATEETAPDEPDLAGPTDIFDLAPEPDPGEAPVDSAPEPAPVDPPYPTIDGTDAELIDQAEDAMRSGELAVVSGTLGTIIGKRDELEAEKAATVKAYGKRIAKLDSRVSELGEKLRELTTEVVIDHEAGVAIYRDKTTGRVVQTRPLAPSERQLDLPLNRPLSPPSEGVAGPVVGLCCEGLDGTPYMVEELKNDSVTLLLSDGTNRTVPGDEWPNFAPDPSTDPQEYVDAFGEAWGANHGGEDPPGTYTTVAGETRLNLGDGQVRA